MLDVTFPRQVIFTAQHEYINYLALAILRGTHSGTGAIKTINKNVEFLDSF